MTDTEPAWLAKARSYIGFHETGSNRGIGQFIDLADGVEGDGKGVGALGDAWCAIFANAMLGAAGVPGTRSAMARSFEHHKNFTRLETPKLGAIVTLWRGSPDAGTGHVGFYIGADGEDVLLLGGNQNDQVSIAPQPRERVTGYWWPKAGAATQPQPARRFENIKATVFNDAMGAYGPIAPDALGVALPGRVRGQRPVLRVTSRASDETAIAAIVDIGPHYDGRDGYPEDRWWETGARPRAETDDRTNGAGIDLTPALARKLGMGIFVRDGRIVAGGGQVDVEILTASESTTMDDKQPTNVPAPVTMPGKQFDLANFFRYITEHRDEAAQTLKFGIGLFNSLHPGAAITVGAPPATPATPPPTSTKNTGIIKTSGWALVLGILGQIAGFIGMPTGAGATTAGLLTDVVPVLTAGLGAIGGFSPLINLGLKALGWVLGKVTKA